MLAEMKSTENPFVIISRIGTSHVLSLSSLFDRLTWQSSRPQTESTAAFLYPSLSFVRCQYISSYYSSSSYFCFVFSRPPLNHSTARVSGARRFELSLDHDFWPLTIFFFSFLTFSVLICTHVCIAQVITARKKREPVFYFYFLFVFRSLRSLCFTVVTLCFLALNF